MRIETQQEWEAKMRALVDSGACPACTAVCAPDRRPKNPPPQTFDWWECEHCKAAYAVEHLA